MAYRNYCREPDFNPEPTKTDFELAKVRMGWARNGIFKDHKTVHLSRQLPGILAGLLIHIRNMQPKSLYIPCGNPIDMLDQLDRETGTADIVREITKRLHFCLTKAGFPEINRKSEKPQFKNKETQKEWLNTSTYLRQR